MNDNRTPTMPQNQDNINESLRRTATVAQNTSDDRLKTIPQNENTSRVATVLANSSADEIEEMNIFDNSLYISDNEYLELKIKKEDRVNIKSGESILFKNKVYNNEKKEVEVLIKVFKTLDDMATWILKNRIEDVTKDTLIRNIRKAIKGNKKYHGFEFIYNKDY